MKYILTVFAVIVLLAPINLELDAQDSQLKISKDVTVTRILFIFDASYSMYGMMGNENKITIAQRVLIKMIDSLEKVDKIEMALRVYGHQSPVPPQDCNDTRLEVPFSKNNASAMRQKLRFITPMGTTPLTISLQKAANDFPKDDENARNIIIMITDGIEECKGDPCAASLELQKVGIILKPFIIGIGIDENFKRSFECMGQFYNASNPEQFSDFLNIVITQALNSTTAQVNLLDQYGKPTETDVALTFFDNLSGSVKHQFLHTINFKGYPDTIILDPLLNYRMRVNTLPPVYVDNISVTNGTHTIISASVPQGYLYIKTADLVSYKGMKFSVRKPENSEVVNFQDLDSKEKYLTGKYSIEIPVIPAIILKDVEIKQNHTTTIEVPRGGILNMLYASSGVGSIYIKEGYNQRWVVNINNENKSSSLLLLPGKYVAVYRPLNAKRTDYTIRRNFEIKAGTAVTISF